jgi:hypothetical protein
VDNNSTPLQQLVSQHQHGGSHRVRPLNSLTCDTKSGLDVARNVSSFTSTAKDTLSKAFGGMITDDPIKEQEELETPTLMPRRRGTSSSFTAVSPKGRLQMNDGDVSNTNATDTLQGSSKRYMELDDRGIDRDGSFPYVQMAKADYFASESLKQDSQDV